MRRNSASKKTYTPSESSIAKAKALRAAKLDIGLKVRFDANGEPHFTESQRQKIARRYKKFEDVLSNPEEYQRVPLERLSTKQKKVYKKTSSKKYVYIPREGYDRIVFNKRGEIVRVIDGGNKRRVEIFDTRLGILERLELFANEPLPDGMTVTVEIPGKGPFARQRFGGHESLLAYLRDWMPEETDDDEESLRQELLSQMQIVYWDEKEFNREHERREKLSNQRKYERAKSRYAKTKDRRNERRRERYLKNVDAYNAKRRADYAKKNLKDED